MNLLSLLGIAIALAMDAFAVSIATGINLKNVSIRQTFRLSWHFALFQALMPIIGWLLGSVIEVYVSAFAHWIAFAVLALVGINMIREAISHEEETEVQRKDATRGMTLIMLSVATSIDALAVGVGMSLVHIAILTPAVIIGIVAGIFTVFGLHLGKKAAQFDKLSPFAEGLGGVVLWLIGINILRENGVFTILF